MKIVYTPEYAGHTIFYIFSKKKHYFYVNPDSTTVDFSVRMVGSNYHVGEEIVSVDSSKIPNHVHYFVELLNTHVELNEEFEPKMRKIIQFCSYQNLKIDYSIENEDHDFLYPIFNFGSFLISFKIQKSTKIASFTVTANLMEFNCYNAIYLIVQHFNCEDFNVVQNPLDDNLRFQKYDILALEFAHPILIHNSKIIDWTLSNQKIMIIENPTLGKGFIINEMIEYFERAGNRTDYFYSKFEKLNPRRIMIIGGEIPILMKIVKSPLFHDVEMILVAEEDEEFIELQKKHFFPLDQHLLHNSKIQFISEDGMNYLAGLKESIKFDLIIITVRIPKEYESHNDDVFQKLKYNHLTQDGEIILNSGFITQDGDNPMHKSEFPSFTSEFEVHTEAVFSPFSSGYRIFYVMKKE
jgi:spermidine synthase